MNGRRERPQRLATKLLAIRQTFAASQSQMIEILHLKTTPARMSEWEHGVREPDLIVLLRYSRVADVQMEVLVDDDLELIIPERK